MREIDRDYIAHQIGEIDKVINELDHCRVWTISAGSKHFMTHQYRHEIRDILVRMKKSYEKLLAYDI